MTIGRVHISHIGSIVRHRCIEVLGGKVSVALGVDIGQLGEHVRTINHLPFKSFIVLLGGAAMMSRLVYISSSLPLELPLIVLLRCQLRGHRQNLSLPRSYSFPGPLRYLSQRTRATQKFCELVTILRSTRPFKYAPAQLAYRPSHGT
jgi:hypothetical protein